MIMLFLAVLPLLSVVTCVVEHAPTYEHQDPHTGEIISCEQCPPGTHLAAHCTSTTRTKCQPCREGHFTELWNYLSRCLYCNNFCTQNQEVETECSPLRNRVCRCKAGFYMQDDFCVRHSECGPGHGVQTRGSSQQDTVCEKCSKGFYSNSSSAVDSCVKHQECTSSELVLLPGSAQHDTVCGTCQDFSNGGETLRTFLSAFFSSHRMTKRDLKRFIHRIIQKSEDEYTSDTSLHNKRGPLLDHIRFWLAQAPVDQLKELPKALRNSGLSTTADRLDKRLTEIMQHDPTCSLSLMQG